MTRDEITLDVGALSGAVGWTLTERDCETLRAAADLLAAPVPAERARLAAWAHGVAEHERAGLTGIDESDLRFGPAQVRVANLEAIARLLRAPCPESSSTRLWRAACASAGPPPAKEGAMFSVDEKRHIAAEIERLLLSLKHPEMPIEKPRFALHVDGAESWSWADIVGPTTAAEAQEAPHDQ